MLKVFFVGRDLLKAGFSDTFLMQLEATQQLPFAGMSLGAEFLGVFFAGASELFAFFQKSENFRAARYREASLVLQYALAHPAVTGGDVLADVVGFTFTGR